ncbi:cyclin dependent kinase inhibitor 1Ca [Nothobranchius furzeri]|uniref:cyclin dependent kinase inhibitor 1Ca n=1 Tax=Nothobranchius furzeri TaxID=105023 RepID=UPI003904C031
MMNNQSREPVCRSLFGPVDHDQLRLDFQLHLKEMSEQDTRRWNFSFQSNAPLHGRFQWEEMSSACTVSFYQESKQLRISAGRPRTEEDESLSNEEKHICKNQENCSSISNKPTSLTEGRLGQTKQLFCNTATKHRANCTNYRCLCKTINRIQDTTPNIQKTSTEAAQC